MQQKRNICKRKPPKAKKAENQLQYVLEQIDAVLIDIDLQQGVVWMYGQFIVIRECYDVVSEFPVGFIGLGGPILAFVQDALHTRMRVEVGPFPTKCRVSTLSMATCLIQKTWQ